MPEVIVKYLEVEDADGPVLRYEVADKAEAVSLWESLRPVYSGLTVSARYHVHHHGDAAEPCVEEALS